MTTAPHQASAQASELLRSARLGRVLAGWRAFPLAQCFGGPPVAIGGVWLAFSTTARNGSRANLSRANLTREP